MATYYTDKSRGFGVTPSVGQNRQLVTQEAIIAVTTAMIDNTNDVINLFWVPKGAVITGITAYATDMDTNGTPTLKFDIGDSGDVDRLLVASTIGQAGTLTTALAVTGFLYKYTARTLITCSVNAVAATGAAGTLYVALNYFVDPEYSTTALTATTTA